MAQLRAVALERLHAGADVVQAVYALDRFAEVVPALEAPPFACCTWTCEVQRSLAGFSQRDVADGRRCAYVILSVRGTSYGNAPLPRRRTTSGR